MPTTFSFSGRNRNAEASQGMAEDASRAWDENEIDRLARRCQVTDGDDDAQRALYEACHPRVFRLAARITNYDAAVDVTQQVFLQAFRNIRQYAQAARFTTWLYRLTVNEALMYARREKRQRLTALTGEQMDHSPLPSDDAENRELLEAALQRLDPSLRAIFVLREVDGLSYSEIAAAMRIPEGTVGSRLNRARGGLREILKEMGWEP